MNEIITSKQNPKLKQLRRLGARKHRDDSAMFSAEGEDLVSAALEHGLQPECVLYDVDHTGALSELLGRLANSVEVIAVKGDVLSSVSTLGSGTRIAGIWPQLWKELDSVREDLPTIYLHDLADPGNVGAVLRSASAFGAGSVVLSEATADPFAPKAVRASMGAIFEMTVLRASFDRLRMRIPGARAVALAPGAGRPFNQLSLTKATLVAVGAERSGLPDRICDRCDEIAHIPLDPHGTESLNAAMTATLCLYEIAVHRLPDVERQTR